MKRFSVSLRLALTTLSLLAAGASPAQASTFTFQVRNNDSGGGPNESGPLPVDSGEVSFASSQGRPNGYLGRASAGPGILRARGLASIEGIPANSNGRNAESRASFTLDDVFITGPVGVTSVNATMNFEVSGVVAVTVPANSSAQAAFTMSVGAEGSFASGSFSVGTTGTVTATGLFAGFAGPTISGNFTSATANFRTTGPNTVSFSIIAGAGAGSNGGAAGQFAQGISNFYDAVHFPTSGPVFNLPEGYTANSLSGSIVNNQWTGAVPEPGSIVLSILGCMGLTAFRRSRRRRDCSGVVPGMKARLFLMKKSYSGLTITRISVVRAIIVAIFSLAALTNSACGQLYGIEFNTGNLYQVSTADAALSLVGNTGITLLGSLEYRPSNGFLYGIGTVTSTGVGSLYRINPANASTTLIGSLGPENVFEGGLVIAPDGTAYATNMNFNTNPTLFKINLDTAATTTVGTISGGDHDINGLAWRSDILLVGLDRVTNSLLAIDPSTAASSVIVAVSPPVGGVGGMAAIGDSGYFAVSNFNGSNSLYSFNLHSGAHTLIGSFAPTITGPGISGLALIPVPEPASVTLAALAIVPLFVRRRRSQVKTR